MTIEEELEEVKRRLDHIWQVIKAIIIEMDDASEPIKGHRDRKEKLEIAADEARTLLSGRRQFLDSAYTIATYAEGMSEFLTTRAFVHSLRQGDRGQVRQRRHRLLHTHAGGLSTGRADAAEIALTRRVRSSESYGGPGRIRTCVAIQGARFTVWWY